MDWTIRLIFVALVGGVFLMFSPLQAYAQDSYGLGSAAFDTASATPTPNEAESDPHSAGSAEVKTFSERLMSWLGSFHPAVVHIPIGLFIAAFLAELLLIKTGQPVFASIVRYCIWIGALGAFLAVPLGWFNAGFQLTDTKEFVTPHRWIGTTAAFWSALLLYIVSTTKEGGNRLLLRTALFVAVGLVAFNGFLGGLIVHGADAHAF
jgi:uncharacterized membrane protein